MMMFKLQQRWHSEVMKPCFFFLNTTIVSERLKRMYLEENFTGGLFCQLQIICNTILLILPDSFSVNFRFQPTHHPQNWVHVRLHDKHTYLLYPWIAADAREQCVQDGVVVVTMQQDKAQKGFQEGSLRHTAQEKVQVGGAGDHLVHRWLQTHTEISESNCKRGQRDNCL